MADADYSLSAHRIRTGEAVALFKLARRASSNEREQFLNPISIKERLVAVPEKDRFAEERVIGQSIREHIRVLSRAVAGWAEKMPDELVQALTDTIRAGALRHEEKSRVAAFSPSYEANALIQAIDCPIAADIGAALRALGDVHRDKLLGAVLETDEPMMLAQLMMDCPQITRGRIQERVAELTPSKAGDIYSLTHVQARIEALLSAGLGEAANWFMEEERELQTWGRGPNSDRELTRLRTALRLNLLRGEWNKISTSEPPPDLTHAVRQLAMDTIEFYKAVAALRNPEGNRQIAEKTFARLQKSHPDVGAYVQNLFAARITLLLNGGFGELQDAALLRGRRILEEAEEMMLRVRVIDGSVTESFQCNKALLLLAMGRSEQAHELLASLNTTGLSTTLSAYRAVALGKLERGPEALAILDQTERMLGSSDLLRAAREHIMSGEPFSVNVNISSDDNPVPRTKAALFDLKQMNPDQQAEVLMAQPAPFNVFVSNHVRSASASVTALVPMMKHVVVDSSEDDLSALIRELLTQSLEFLGWSVSDQSKGGHTAKGNPGERDLILKKGSTTLAVIEAVVCKQYVSSQNLKKHFQKLFSYSECNLFFLLTYSYIENPSDIVYRLREVARNDSPDGFEYYQFDEIPHTDSRPAGFTAHYKAKMGTVKVVFLVLDLNQHSQRNAAITSTNKRSTLENVSSSS